MKARSYRSQTISGFWTGRRLYHPFWDGTIWHLWFVSVGEWCEVEVKIDSWFIYQLPSLKLTARTWKWMVGRLSVSLLGFGLFSGAKWLVLGRVMRRLHQKRWLICEPLVSLPPSSLMKFVDSLLQFVLWWSPLSIIARICMFCIWYMRHTYIICMWICTMYIHNYSHILIISLYVYINICIYIYIVSTCNMCKTGAQLLPAVTGLFCVSFVHRSTGFWRLWHDACDHYSSDLSHIAKASGAFWCHPYTQHVARSWEFSIYWARKRTNVPWKSMVGSDVYPN